MSARRKSFHASSSSGRRGQSDGTRAEQAEGSSSVDGLDGTRAKMVQDRQEELDRVFDTHDTLVREAFHLEKFVSLLTYDPKAAKEDRSDVFQRFQAQYDLVDHSAAAGPSRRTTRRAHTQRLQVLTAHGASTSTTPPSKKSRQVDDSPGAAFWDIKAEAKSKGKQQHGHGPESASISYGRKGKGKAVDAPSSPVVSPKAKSARRASLHDESATRADTPVRSNGVSQPPPRKKRRVAQELSAVEIPSFRHPLRSSASMPKLSAGTSPVLSRRNRKSTSLAQDDTEPAPSPVKHPIPRVKLIVRKPPTILTNPLQKPSPPVFGGSLDALLSSYTIRGDREVTVEELEADMAGELALWRRVDKLRQQGRMLDRSSYVFKGPPPQDAWASIVAEVVDGREMAANVAGKIRKYWEGENKAEEARLRSLARSTLHMVVAQWKKAVYHVREQARLEWEAEERRRGQEHLNAILDQSGQILSIQLHDLARDSRSRSRSVSMHDFDRDHTPTESDRGGEQSDSDEESSDSESAAGDEGISMLVPDMELENASHVGRSRSASMEADLDLEADMNLDTTPGSDLEGVSSGDVEPPEDEDPAPSSAVTYVYASKQPDSMHIDDDGIATPKVGSPAANGDVPHEEVLDNEEAGRPDISVPSATLAEHHAAPLEETAPPRESLEDTPTMPVEAAEAPGLPSANVTLVAEEDIADDEVEEDSSIPYYLRPYAVAPVEWDPQAKVKPPLLLRGSLRPYQQAGLEWLASIHARNLNGILADEMGLGKTIQTIALLAHLACDRGIWGPHLIIVPTSVLLNWEMEFKKFLPGFKVLSYHGNTKQRKELRQGWNNKYHFNACITSYTLASRDAHVFKRKRWYYMILDEAHMIKNFKSQRWNILLMFRSFRRLLLTGTPLQNNLTELWALLQFLMSGTDFANLKEFGEWFANPLERAIEMGAIDDETQQRVSKLHTVLRPYLLRRLKRDVEKELPQKYEHIVMCPLSKRQRFLYDEFMARAETRHDLQSGVYQKIANILMQLRKVVNHPDLFEVRPIVTSFAMPRSAVADYEIKELLVRRRLLAESDEDKVNLGFLGLRFVGLVGASEIAARETRRLDGTFHLPMITELPGEPPPRDTRTIPGFRAFRAYQQRASAIARWAHIGYINRLRCGRFPVYSAETLALAQRCYTPLAPVGVRTQPKLYLSTPERAQTMVQSYVTRAESVAPLVDRFAFATPSVVARDLPAIALTNLPPDMSASLQEPQLDEPLHRAAVKLQIAFPDPSLLQFDCGKLQVLAKLLRERKAGGHRILIFTQMTRILDILEIFLNFHGYLYLRLDGATKIEDRQYITERFNADPRIFCFISSSRSGGVGINLTGADTVIFYDSDFNPQMDRQCEDRAHRIGQVRDVHIYRFISQHTVEEALLRKANQKRSLDDLVIQKGEFDWRTLFTDADEGALTRALGEFEDVEDAQAAQLAAREELQLEDEDAQDFEAEGTASADVRVVQPERASAPEAGRATDVPLSGGDKLEQPQHPLAAVDEAGADRDGQVADNDQADGVLDDDDEEEGRTVDDYMIDWVHLDSEFFGTSDWNV
ncbi:SNF2 family N-terminal domain-containing protein [Cerioporus squamosus]|nr:SNF2 family N-terminal domain-containing protein [Cerioporus squamosus]